MRAYEFIAEARKEYSDRDIEDVKWAYDQGESYDAISRMTGLHVNEISAILGRYYPERKRRAEHLKSALIDDDKEKIVYDFMDGGEINSIADDMGISPSLVKLVLRDRLGVDEIRDELNRRRTLPGSKIKNKITPEMMDIIKAGYIAGKRLNDISDEIGNVVTGTSILRALKNDKDWPELRAKWEEKQRAIRHGPQATRRIYRSGERDNLRSKGPGTRHTYGVKWSE